VGNKEEQFDVLWSIFQLGNSILDKEMIHVLGRMKHATKNSRQFKTFRESFSLGERQDH
jgi:hypothetical protein